MEYLSQRALQAARPAAYLDDLNPAQRAAVEALDGPVLVECLSPMSLPIWPCFIDGGLTIPGLPGLDKVAALKGVLGACSDHGLFGDWYITIL